MGQRSGETASRGDPAVAAALRDALLLRGRVTRATHGFHTYPAGLHPDAAAQLLGLAPGPVLDPFCGGGTVLVEAMLAGRDALGCDISPVAILVARARTARTTEAERTALRVAARAATEAALHAPPLDRAPELLRTWYVPDALAELRAIQLAIGNDALLRAVFSSILVKVSRRASDTSNQALDAERPRGTTATLFHRRAREYARMLEALATGAPETARARVHREDARDLRESAAFGLVLTSPPYPGVYDYVPLQQLRHAWLELELRDAPVAEIGARRNFRADRSEAAATWRADTARWLRAAARALAPTGRLVVATGDGNVGGKAIDSLTPHDEGARAAGLRFVASATVERMDEGLGVIRPEHAICWEKP